MQVYAYTDEVISRLNAYARSINPPPRVRYNLVLTEVQVPQGYLPIKITQFFRLDPTTGHPVHHEWAIFVPTSPVRGIGNYYEFSGDLQSHRIKTTINNYNARRGFERGSHIVGFVLPAALPYLEAQLALVLVDASRQPWVGQTWVCDALRGLNHQYIFALRTTLENLAKQMAIVSAAWEAGDVD